MTYMWGREIAEWLDAERDNLTWLREEYPDLLRSTYIGSAASTRLAIITKLPGHILSD